MSWRFRLLSHGLVQLFLLCSRRGISNFCWVSWLEGKPVTKVTCVPLPWWFQLIQLLLVPDLKLKEVLYCYQRTHFCCQVKGIFFEQWFVFMSWTRCWIDNGNVCAFHAQLGESHEAWFSFDRRNCSLVRTQVVFQIRKDRERSQKKVICSSCIVLRQRNWSNMNYYGMSFDRAMIPYDLTVFTVYRSLSVCLSVNRGHRIADDGKRSETITEVLFPYNRGIFAFLWSFCDHREIKHSAETQKQKSLKKFGG